MNKIIEIIELAKNITRSDFFAKLSAADYNRGERHKFLIEACLIRIIEELETMNTSEKK